MRRQDGRGSITKMTSGAASIPRSKRWACRRPLCCARISSRRAAPSPTSECTGSKRICISNACGHRTSRSRPGSWITDTLALGSAAPGPSEHSAQRRFHYGWLSGAGSAAWPAEIGFEADSPLEGESFNPSLNLSRLRRAEIGQHHRISGHLLHQYANEAAWREDNRRKPNGTNWNAVIGAALAGPKNSGMDRLLAPERIATITG